MERIKRAGIIGQGMIGCSMAVLTTGHGVKTVCLARDEAKYPDYKRKYDEYFAQMIAHGLLTEKQAKRCTELLSYTTDYSDLDGCDIIFECAAEDKAVKHAVYSQIEEHCENVRAICSVSSSIVADVLAEKAGKYRDRILVTHPFNPAHMVPYFEICGGSATDPAAVEFTVEALKFLDRQPVVLKKPAPGFIGNRLQFALWREALNIVDSGIADPEDVDTCLKYSFCPRYTSIGIYEHFDGGGMHLCKATCDSVFPTLSNISEAPYSINGRIERGELGQKAGIGFYDWRGVDMDAYAERVAAPYWRFMNWDYPQEED